jgi:hypothetical protein
MNVAIARICFIVTIVGSVFLSVGCSKKGPIDGDLPVKVITISPEAIAQFNQHMTKNELSWDEMAVLISDKDALSPTSPLAMKLVHRREIDFSQHREYKIEDIPFVVEKKILQRLSRIDIKYVIQDGKPGFLLDFHPDK